MSVAGVTSFIPTPNEQLCASPDRNVAQPGPRLRFCSLQATPEALRPVTRTSVSPGGPTTAQRRTNLQGGQNKQPSPVWRVPTRNHPAENTAQSAARQRPQWTPQKRQVVDGASPASRGGVQGRLLSSLIGQPFASSRGNRASSVVRT